MLRPEEMAKHFDSLVERRDDRIGVEIQHAVPEEVLVGHDDDPGVVPRVHGADGAPDRLLPHVDEHAIGLLDGIEIPLDQLVRILGRVAQVVRGIEHVEVSRVFTHPATPVPALLVVAGADGTGEVDPEPTELFGAPGRSMRGHCCFTSRHRGAGARPARAVARHGETSAAAWKPPPEGRRTAWQAEPHIGGTPRGKGPTGTMQVFGWRRPPGRPDCRRSSGMSQRPTECPRNAHGMATECPRNARGMTTEWPRNDHGMATDWPKELPATRVRNLRRHGGDGLAVSAPSGRW